MSAIRPVTDRQYVEGIQIEGDSPIVPAVLRLRDIALEALDRADRAEKELSRRPQRVSIDTNMEPIEVMDPDNPSPYRTYEPGPRSLHIEMVDPDGGQLTIDTGPLGPEFKMTRTEG